MSSRDERREQSDRTRKELLEAGLVLLHEAPADKLFEQLEARPVAARAGVTSGAFYYHFASADEFTEALLQYALEQSPNPEIEKVAPIFDERARRGDPFPAAFRAATAAAMEFQRSDPTFPLMLAVASKAHRDSGMRTRLARMYRTTEDLTAPYYEAIAAMLEVEMRPPYTFHDLAAAFITIYEGLALRQASDPDRMAPDQLGLFLMPIIAMMTRPIGGTETAEDWIERHVPNWAAPPSA